jgi:hypothetical protein
MKKIRSALEWMLSTIICLHVLLWFLVIVVSVISGVALTWIVS